jgi:DNA-binding response OmpR family regulator
MELNKFLNASTANLNSTIYNAQNNVVLVIEDNKDVQEYISVCLKEYYNLIFANDGADGIQKAIAESPDLIICDIMMPLKNGYEVCTKLKSDIITSHIPFIMLTAKASQTNKLKGLELGADAYLYKPFDKTELLLTINNLIVQRERLQNALNSSVLKPIESKYDKEKLFLNDVNVIIRNNHSNEQFGVEMLTHKLFMSRSQLYRKIKALTNKSIAAYIRTIRLQDGMLQLKTTDKSITEIAYSVGFKNLTYFSSSFSQEFGCSPNSISRG